MDPAVHVMVVGEFKQGKSSLVNALVDSVVCPVDDDVATAVPTLVRYADPPSARVVFEPEGAEDARIEEIPFDDLPVYASETGNPGNQRRVRSVEAGVPNALLVEGTRPRRHAGCRRPRVGAQRDHDGGVAGRGRVGVRRRTRARSCRRPSSTSCAGPARCARTSSWC